MVGHVLAADDNDPQDGCDLETCLSFSDRIFLFGLLRDNHF